MDYFWIKQDERYQNTPVLEGFYNQFMRKYFTLEHQEKVPENNIFYSNSSTPLDFLDIVDQQVFMVSKAFKKIIVMYDSSVSFKTMYVLNNRLNEYKDYYVPILDEVECIKSKRWDGAEHLHVDTPIFRAKRLDKEMVLVRLDFMESVLRRNLKGIRYVRMETGAEY